MVINITKFQKLFYSAFLYSLILCLSPSNALAYLSPAFFLLFLIINIKTLSLPKNIFIYICVVFYISLLYWGLNHDFILGNSLLSYFTYSAIVPVLVIPSRFISSWSLYHKILKLLIIVVLIESILGLSQSLYGFIKLGSFDLNAGDYIEGTIHPQLNPEGSSFSNPIFAVILISMLIFIFSFYQINKKGKWVLLLGLLTFILASVMHVIIFFLLAIIGSLILINLSSHSSYRNRRIIFSLSIFFLAVFILLNTALKSNTKHTFHLATQVIEQRFPKAKVMVNFYSQLSKEYSYAPAFGLGPGQFLSRASLISTGRYFGSPRDPVNLQIPFTQMTLPFFKYANDYWIDSVMNQGWASSSTARPQSSWNAILSEFGLLGFLVLLIFLFKIIRKVIVSSKNHAKNKLAFSFLTCLIFLFLIGFQENYWEVPQAIFIPILLMKLSYSLIVIKTPQY